MSKPQQRNTAAPSHGPHPPRFEKPPALASFGPPPVEKREPRTTGLSATHLRNVRGEVLPALPPFSDGGTDILRIYVEALERRVAELARELAEVRTYAWTALCPHCGGSPCNHPLACGASRAKR